MRKRNSFVRVTVGLCILCILFMTVITTADAAPKGFGFKYNKVTVYMNSNASKLIKKAGKPESRTESNSCAFDGKTYTYQYNSFILKTYTKGKKSTEYVSEIDLISDKVSTKEGIKIGSSKNDMIDAYGEGKEKFGVYTYSKGKSKLMFTIDDDKVTGIKYIAK